MNSVLRPLTCETNVLQHNTVAFARISTNTGVLYANHSANFFVDHFYTCFLFSLDKKVLSNILFDSMGILK